MLPAIGAGSVVTLKAVLAGDTLFEASFAFTVTHKVASYFFSDSPFSVFWQYYDCSEPANDTM